MHKRNAARLARHVSASRVGRQPGPPLPGQPQAPPAGATVHVHGRAATLVAHHGDRLLLRGHVSHLAPGLLFKWRGYTWRVTALDPTIAVVEAWGPTFMDSPKLADFTL